jgi:vacuolar-type H+-ATPase subunit H
MKEDIAQEILHELFSSLEVLETQITGVMQFLKDRGTANEEDLAPFLERAGNASNIRWRAARARIDYLLASATKTAEQVGNTGTETSRRTETEKDTPGKQEIAASGKRDADDIGTSTEKDRNQQVKEDKRASKNPAENAA